MALLFPPRDEDAHAECQARGREVLRAAAEIRSRPPTLAGAALPLVLSPLALGCVVLAGRAEGWACLGWAALGGWLLTLMGLIGHDCTHRACAPGRAWNDRIARWIFAHLYMSYESYRALHLAHHTHNAFDEDPSADSPKLTKQTNLVTHLLFILVPAGFPFFQILPGWLAGLGLAPADFPKVRRGHVGRDALTAVALHGALLWGLGWETYRWYPVAFGFACLLVMQLLAFNHVEIEAYTECTLCNTRNVRSIKPIQWLTLNTGFHVEHHLMPSVPWYRLPEVNRLLEDEGGHSYRVDGFLLAHGRVLLHHLRTAFTGSEQDSTVG